MRRALQLVLVGCILTLLLFGTANPLWANFILQGIDQQNPQNDVTAFLNLLNNANVSVGGNWVVNAQNQLIFQDNPQIPDNFFATQLNNFINQQNQQNQNRNLLVGSNVPFIFFGGWGADPLNAALLQRFNLQGQGTQVLDLADLGVLRGNVQAEPLLDITASMLLHELSEVNFDGANFNNAHAAGIASQNQLLANAGSNGQRGAGGFSVPVDNNRVIFFDWQNILNNIPGWEAFVAQGRVGNNIVPLQPNWIARGVEDIGFTDPEIPPPTDLQVDVLDYYFVPVPEPSTLLLLGAGLAGVGLLRRKFKS